MVRSLKLMLFIFIFLSNPTFAAVPTWEIIPNESKITFTGTQNNSPVSGEFKKFTGDIKGDINQLDKSSVLITIDTRSVSTSFKDLEDTLKTADWFNIDLFPTALFTAKDFTKIGTDTYQAKGKLTIRDVSLPMVVTFNVEEYTKDKARIKGTMPLKRTAFGVGKGEWGSTDEVKDEVVVHFMLTAKKK